MKYLALIFLLLQTTPPVTIESVEISGVSESLISQALRDDMQKLAGSTFEQQAADNIVDRIQGELPGYIAASRLIAGTQPGWMKLVFIVARREEMQQPDPPRLPDPPEPPEPESNINSRYTVESAEILGLNDVNVSDALLEDLQKLVGRKLDQQEVTRLQRRLSAELRSSHNVTRRVTRGEMRGHVKVIFEVSKIQWIRFRPTPPKFAYHSKQAFSVGIDIPFEIGEDNRLILGYTLTNQDDLIERFQGFRGGFETTRVFTDRVGIRIDLSTYRQQWNPTTENAFLATPDAPELYRRRNTFEGAVMVAFDPRLRLSAGASATELETQFPSSGSLLSNTGFLTLNFTDRWESDNGTRQIVEADYTGRTGTRNLDSDYVFTKHSITAGYRVRNRRNRASVTFLAGGISGSAPLFERFSLGNTQTLRGWNKFDIAPLGADRVVHGSLELGYRVFNVFYDAGALWDKAQPVVGRHSAGFGFGGLRTDNNWYISLAFPLCTSGVKPVFMMGVRF